LTGRVAGFKYKQGFLQANKECIVWSSDFDPFFEILFVHAFLDREWEHKSKKLIMYFLIFSLFVPDLVFSCQKVQNAHSMIKQICTKSQNPMFISDLNEYFRKSTQDKN
jgi:hypothetical protein